MLYDTARVPMLLAHPDGRYAGTVVEEPVASIDLMPTLLSWLGVPAVEGLDGLDLGPLFTGGSLPKRALYTEQSTFFPVRAVRDARHLLLHRTRPASRLEDTEPVLYERGTPLRPADDAAAKAGLLAALETLQEGRGESSRGAEISDEIRAQLEALGYTGEEGDAPAP